MNNWNKEEIETDITRQIQNADRCLDLVRGKGKNYFHAIDEYLAKKDIFSSILNNSITNSKEDFLAGLNKLKTAGPSSYPAEIIDKDRYTMLWQGTLDGLIIEESKF